MKVRLFGPLAIDTVDLIKELSDQQRVNLIQEACNALDHQGSIEKVRQLVSDPNLDD